jgi:hypothetical protein
MKLILQLKKKNLGLVKEHKSNKKTYFNPDLPHQIIKKKLKIP